MLQEPAQLYLTGSPETLKTAEHNSSCEIVFHSSIFGLRSHMQRRLTEKEALKLLPHPKPKASSLPASRDIRRTFSRLHGVSGLSCVSLFRYVSRWWLENLSLNFFVHCSHFFLLFEFTSKRPKIFLFKGLERQPFRCRGLRSHLSSGTDAA